jgi:predicted transcriptional regulator
MTVTTIKLESDLRDRLARLAARHRNTLGQELAELVRQAEEAEWWDEVDAGWERLAAEPGGLADYRAETAELVGPASIVDGDPGVAEYPEYAEDARRYREEGR